MGEIEQNPKAEKSYEEHLHRSKSVWDRWSNWYTLSERDFEPIRSELIDQLELEEGDTVLEIGCGPGVNFELIRSAIGADGRLVAIDYSPAMVELARERIEEHGWENIEVHEADATTANLGDGYDVVIATLALSVMPDIERAIKNIHDSLKVGGQLGVLDLQPVQSGPLRLLNPLLRRFLRWYANWNTNDRVKRAINAVFGDYNELDTYLLGTAYTLIAIRQAED